jgi:hypothetical protein
MPEPPLNFLVVVGDGQEYILSKSVGCKTRVHVLWMDMTAVQADGHLPCGVVLTLSLSDDPSWL